MTKIAGDVLVKVATFTGSAYKLWIAVHSEPYRKYHNWEHIRDVLLTIEQMLTKERCVAFDELTIAVLFHDFFYTPGLGANDVPQSAEMAYIIAKSNGHNEESACRIRNLIMTTMIHDPGNIDQKILCDADLSILGRDERDYKEYTRKIREEFYLLPEETFIRGRKKILESLLMKDQIFHTEYGLNQWEIKARNNIYKEITSLANQIIEIEKKK